MARKKTTEKSTTNTSRQPRSFAGVIKGRSREVQTLAKALRNLVLETVPDAVETFYGSQKPMSMYRTIAHVCWIQPLKERCNVYFTRGADLTDDAGILEGSSDRICHAKVKSIETIDDLPLQDFILGTVELNKFAVSHGLQRFTLICGREERFFDSSFVTPTSQYRLRQ